MALAGLFASLLFFVVNLLIGQWSSLFAVYASSWFFLGAALIWLVLAIQFHQRALAEQEKVDLSQIAKKDIGSTIFQQKGEQERLFAVAQRRLAILEKWFVPIFSVVVAAYQAGLGVYLLKVAGPVNAAWVKQPLYCAVVMTAVAFISFLVSRYATGMSSQAHWKPLRAGGSFLFGSAIVCFVLAIAVALVQYKIFVVINVINYVLPVMLIILGAETGLNVVLDIYRPRLPGQYSRAGFDSRLLGIINEPGEILHTAAGAIDYQFGFKVSQTWFYKLLAKALVPLVLFGAATMYLLTCVVVINPNEQAIIEHWGNPLDGDGDVRLAGPGLAFKWPWPIDIARKHPTAKVEQLYIGFVPKTDPKTGEIVREPLLWGKEHYEEEYSVLVASEQTAAQSGEGAAAVSLLKASVPVQYRVRNLYEYLYNHSDAEKQLEAICYRELARYAAGATIEVDSAAAISRSLLGAGRAEAKRVLTDKIQAAADSEGLGVEIVFLGLQGIHPPVEVATDYQKVVGAVQKKEAIMLEAEADRNMTLSILVGSVAEADELYRRAIEYQDVRESGDTERTEELGRELDRAFAEAQGDIFAELAGAQSYAYERATLAKATGERFASQLKAYRAAKRIYANEQRLAVFEESLEGIRKYVVAVDTNDTEIFIVDLKEKLTPSLYELGGYEESSEQ